ncbi:MAG: ATP-binding cassette domain-containing protein [Ruminococcus sp.]|nr:ATP-binding cassette domain-containing protein [Ruminococcus sp.]
MALLSVENLSFCYPLAAQNAFKLNNISFSIESGEMLLLYGKSGSGKSTLLKLLKPEISPYGKMTGKIIFEDKALSSISQKESVSKIGFVAQNPSSSFVTEKVITELAFLLENLNFPKDKILQRIAEISVFFGLESILDRKLYTLSSGQKQLVNLAAVMVGYPQLLLLDEPTSRLDPISTENFYNTLSKIRRELGTTIVLCEHNIKNVINDCDNMLFLEEGEQKFLLPPSLASKRLENHPMFLGFPCSYRLSASLDLSKTLKTPSECMEFVRKSYKNEDISKKEDCVSNDDLSVAFELKDVYFRFEKHSRDIISDLNFSSNYGEVTAICGANGTGKSTLLNIIAGALPSLHGKVIIDKKNISSYKNGSLYRGNVALLPQNPRDLFTQDCVLDDLLSLPNYPKKSEQEILTVVESLGLERGLLDLNPLDLSEGEIQRAALAKLLLTNPRILLLDEPDKGLDCVNLRLLSDTLRALSSQGKCVVLVTHNLEFAAQASDKIAMLFGGRISSYDTTRNFLMDNFVYTTDASRISRNVFPCAYTTERLIDSCLHKMGDD